MYLVCLGGWDLLVDFPRGHNGVPFQEVFISIGTWRPLQMALFENTCYFFLMYT
jgi:hypothetical protein